MKWFLNLLLCGTLPLFMVGCEDSSADPAPKPATGTEVGHDDQDHHGAGPHGGTIGEWGAGDYHTEFTVDHKTQEATVYILGEDAKTAKPVKAEKLLLNITEPAFQVDLIAMPQDGETGGVSSRFVGKNPALGNEQAFAGSITGEVEGIPYTGDFKEEAAHDHDHK